MTSPTAPRGPPRRHLWLLVAVFFVPLVAAFVLYYGLDGWRPAGSTAHGDLIRPARPLPRVALDTPSGEPLAPDFLRGHWTLVYIGDGACDERCRAALRDMRQVRLALGDEMSRVERVFLYTDSCCDTGYLAAEHPGLIVAWLDATAGARLLEPFPTYDGIAPAAARRIYVVDPLGNLMMSYAPDAPARGMLEDLKKLLKLSHIG